MIIKTMPKDLKKCQKMTDRQPQQKAPTEWKMISLEPKDVSQAWKIIDKKILPLPVKQQVKWLNLHGKIDQLQQQKNPWATTSCYRDQIIWKKKTYKN